MHAMKSPKRTPARAALLLAMIAVALPIEAPAQEFELDLTDTTDYRPALAVLGVAVVDPEVPTSAAERLRVETLGAEVARSAVGSELFSSVLTPEQVFAQLSDDYGAALRCASPDCLTPLAQRLGVNQLVLGQVAMQEGHPLLRVLTYTRFAEALHTAEVKVEPRRDLARQVSAAFQSAMRQGITPLGLLKIRSETAGATASLGSSRLGPIPLELRVPPGSHVLRVEAEGHLADEIDLTLAANERKEIESNLVPKPADPPPEPAPPPVAVERPAPSRPLWTRPGLYLAAAGVAAIGVGLGLGASAKSIEARARDLDGDGALDITRRERGQALRNAAAANVLVGVGAAAFAGGTVWVLLTPSIARSEPDLEPLAVTIGVGGTFP